MVIADSRIVFIPLQQKYNAYEEVVIPYWPAGIL